MSKSPNVSMRLSPDLVRWLEEYVETADPRPPSREYEKLNKTGLVRELLQALRERRLMIAPAAIPFINDGSSPEYPVLVCLNPKRK